MSGVTRLRPLYVWMAQTGKNLHLYLPVTNRQVTDACECGNEPSGSVKCGEFLDYLQTS